VDHPVAHQGPALEFKSTVQIHQDYFVGNELFVSSFLTAGARACQNLPFDASFAADMTPPVICRICSPALVN
jgi:hypothetical protein